MTFQRIHIIGASGSGKTYLGQKLSQATGYPLQDLDELKWNNSAGTYGVSRPDAERDDMLRNVIAQPQWIVEGIYYKWVTDSFAKADAIIILQPSSFIRNYRMIMRFIKRKTGLLRSKNETIKDLIDLIAWTNDYHHHKVPEIIAMTDMYADKRFFFRSADKALAFIRSNSS